MFYFKYYFYRMMPKCFKKCYKDKKPIKIKKSGGFYRKSTTTSLRSKLSRSSATINEKEEDTIPSFYQMAKHYDELIDQVHYRLSLK